MQRALDVDQSKPRSDKKSYRLVNVGAVRVLLVDDNGGVQSGEGSLLESDEDDDDDGTSTPVSSCCSGSGELESSTCCSDGPIESGSANAYVAWCFPVGSVDDPPDRPGLAHFCEHMIFSERVIRSSGPMHL